MVREFPDVPFERYCDDIIVHARSERQAQYVRAMVAARLADCGLELNEQKTRIVTAADNVWVNCGLSEVCEYDSEPKEIIAPHYDESIVTKSIYAVYIAIDRSGDLAVSAGRASSS